MKKTLATILACVLCGSMFAGCSSGGSSSSQAGSSSAPAPAGSSGAASTPAAGGGAVYYLNFKPEADANWQELAKIYSEQTGVEVTVVTAAAGQYETTLKSEIAKTEAPTLFQVNGPVGLASWKDYCYDLSDSEIYNQLTSPDFALKEGDAVLGVAYAIETYGIIYNKELLNKYIAMEGAAIKSIDELNNFATLKAVAEDIQKRKADLGVDGAFSSAGMDGSSDWRFKTHLANLPIYYEYKADGIAKTDAIKGTYLDNYKQMWDLYINNSTCQPSVLSSKTGDDSLAEFVTGKAVFYQNGTWAYNDVKDLGDENIGMMPIYVGIDGEQDQALCTGSENYWCVNNKAKPEDIQATLEFLKWIITSDEGRTALGVDMAFATPFKTFTEEFTTKNPFIDDANRMIAEGKAPVAWTFTTMPSENWKNGVGSALTEYAQGTAGWDKVVTAFVDGWATEIAATK